MLADNIIILGVNHKTAPVGIREQLAFTGDSALPFSELMALEGVTECCILSTCNRVEIIVVSRDPGKTARLLRPFLFGKSAVNDREFEKYSYLHQGEAAITHLFRVGASLDSMIVGEPQILGQLKQAFKASADNNCTGAILTRFLHKSFSVAKRVRTETNIGGSAVSISYAAVELAKKIFGDLQDKTVMLVGAGEMAELAAEHLITQGISQVIVVNRTFENAVKLARRFNGKAAGLDDLVPLLENVDILISSTGATDLVLKQEDVKPVMNQRMNRPLFLIDIAVPRDLDEKLNKLDNVYLYDIDDLTHVVDINKAERDKEAGRGERIVVEETMKFAQWLEGMEVTPTIVALRQKADAICRAEVARTAGNLKDLSPKAQKSIEKMAGAIANKLLHDPITYMKTDQPGDKGEKLALIRRLFSLDDDPA
ncbi:MAG: glutamyl-tRNA reductase [Desulfurivibrionaceae bacterium]|nr:glutamyl-tRNA reductase [Desulfobulbales bacterium]MDT8334267.1 glutamyl-tRNA reductase [Desulfurivibrionaceae bacterium]